MRVAFILPGRLPIPAIKGGAIETLLNNLIDENEREGSLDFTVFSEFQKDAYRLSKHYRFSRFIYIKRGALYRFINIFFRVLKKITVNRTCYLDIYLIAWNIRRLNIDKIIVEGSTFKLLELRKLFDKNKLIFRLHADLIKEKTSENLKIVNSASLFIVASNFLLRRIKENSDGLNPQVKILRNGIKLDNFRNTAKESCTGILEKFRIPDSVPIILYVGRIVESKGIMHLLAALKNLRHKVSFHFLIVGSFGSGFGFEDEADEFSIKLQKSIYENQDWITVTGFIHNSDLPAIYNISDLMVVPSICEDVSPLVINEAMAAGTPLIITDAGGMTEYVSDECAVIINNDNNMVDNLSKEIITILQDPVKLMSMREAGLVNALKYSTENFYREFCSILSNSFMDKQESDQTFY